MAKKAAKSAAKAEENVPPSAVYAIEVADRLNKDNVPPSCWDDGL